MRGLTALVVTFPLLSGLAITSASPATPAFPPPSLESYGTAQGGDLSAPRWVTLVPATRLLRGPISESSGSGAGPADHPFGTPESHIGPPPLGHPPTGPTLPSMEARAGLSSHRATAPPPRFLA